MRKSIGRIVRFGLRCLLGAMILAIPVSRASENGAAVDTDNEREVFERDVRPLLVERCYSCHGPDAQKSELRLDSRAAMLAGGLTGPAVVPGKPDESLLVEAVRYEDMLKMPPKAKLDPAQIDVLTRWVERGAWWPQDTATAPAPSATDQVDDIIVSRSGHWSFQPIRAAVPPDVTAAEWADNPIDLFVLAKLEEHQLRPAAQADRRTLIRRLYFDVIGLPPKPEEVEAFVENSAPDAYERLVDQLLASPRMGERWARHWLDLVRFAETSGHEFDYEIPHAYRYRDYVVRAINDDVPYDAFVTEHIAGDLLTAPRRDALTGMNESIAGTGFFMLGEGTHSPVDVREEQVRRIDNQIDVTGKAFLGLTIACARCHDHKFDPIRARDYYALAGYLKAARHQQASLNDSPAARADVQALRDTMRAIGNLLTLPEAVGANDSPPMSDVYEDFRGPDFGLWHASGLAFGDGPSVGGDVRIQSDGLVHAVPSGIAHSGLAADSLAGVLRSPTFTIERKFIHVLAAGRQARVQVVVDGFEKIRDPIYGGLIGRVDSGEAFRWHSLDVSAWIGQRAYLELADGGVVDFTGSQSAMLPSDGFLAVDQIRYSDGPPPDGDVVGATPVKPCDALRDPSRVSELERLMGRTRELAARLSPRAYAPALVDGTGDDERILLRGNYRTPGELVPRRFLEVFARANEASSDGGRLELARRVLDPSNPLPARVVVNRIWQHHFGRGLVGTPDDFGHMGQAPSHPELLDWLAGELVRNAWSTKHIHRLILGSRTYRMASVSDATSEARDPDNRWLHRANVRRLEAEPLRDAMLAVAGCLDQTFFGPSVLPYLNEFMQGRGRPSASGPLDGDNRRSLYLNVRRNFLTPFLTAFDFPSPATTMGRRNVSNVPAQALTLLNDPLVLELSRRWAERECQCGEEAAAQRIGRMFAVALGRAPSGDELAASLSFVADHGGPDDSSTWADLAQVLFNHKEFLFIP